MRKLKNYEQCLFETYGLTADHVEADNVLSSQPVLKAQDFSRVLQSLPQTRPGPKGVGSYPGFSCSQPKSTHLNLIKPVRPRPIKGSPFIGKGLKKGAWTWFWSHLFYPSQAPICLNCSTILIGGKRGRKFCDNPCRGAYHRYFKKERLKRSNGPSGVMSAVEHDLLARGYY